MKIMFSPIIYLAIECYRLEILLLERDKGGNKGQEIRGCKNVWKCFGKSSLIFFCFYLCLYDLIDFLSVY